MPLFTILAEYRGGTYIRQITAASPMTALIKWSRKKRNSIPASLVPALRQLAAEGDKAIRIKGCKNIWCLSTSYQENLLLLNIVNTSTKQNPNTLKKAPSHNVS
jgi:hypothetical protein